MKPVIIIAIAFVLLIGFISPVFAQSSSLEDLCPRGYTAEAKGIDIVCVSNSDPLKTTQSNNAQSLDDQTSLIVGGVIVVIIIIAIVVKVASGGGNDSDSGYYSDSYRDVKRRGFSAQTKRQVKEEQDGRCDECAEIPTHWEFHHIAGRGDNSIENCRGLCRDCHQDKTLKDDW